MKILLILPIILTAIETLPSSNRSPRWSYFTGFVEDLCSEKCQDNGKPLGRMRGATCSCYCPITNPPPDNDPCDDSQGPSCQRYCKKLGYSGGACPYNGICLCFCPLWATYPPPGSENGTIPVIVDGVGDAFGAGGGGGETTTAGAAGLAAEDFASTTPLAVAEAETTTVGLDQNSETTTVAAEEAEDDLVETTTVGSNQEGVEESTTFGPGQNVPGETTTISTEHFTTAIPELDRNSTESEEASTTEFEYLTTGDDDLSEEEIVQMPPGCSNRPIFAQNCGGPRNNTKPPLCSATAIFTGGNCLGSKRPVIGNCGGSSKNPSSKCPGVGGARNCTLNGLKPGAFQGGKCAVAVNKDKTCNLVFNTETVLLNKLGPACKSAVANFNFTKISTNNAGKPQVLKASTNSTRGSTNITSNRVNTSSTHSNISAVVPKISNSTSTVVPTNYGKLNNFSISAEAANLSPNSKKTHAHGPPATRNQSISLSASSLAASTNKTTAVPISIGFSTMLTVPNNVTVTSKNVSILQIINSKFSSRPPATFTSTKNETNLNSTHALNSSILHSKFRPSSINSQIKINTNSKPIPSQIPKNNTSKLNGTLNTYIFSLAKKGHQTTIQTWNNSTSIISGQTTTMNSSRNITEKSKHHHKTQKPGRKWSWTSTALKHASKIQKYTTETMKQLISYITD